MPVGLGDLANMREIVEIGRSQFRVEAGQVPGKPVPAQRGTEFSERTHRRDTRRQRAMLGLSAHDFSSSV